MSHFYLIVLIFLAILIEGHQQQDSTEIMSYSYSPQELLKSYEDLKLKEASACNEIDTTPRNTPGGNHPSGSIQAAAIQITASGLPNSDVEGFWALAQQAVEKAALEGANLILLPELFIGPYFCQSQEADLMALAEAINEQHFIIKRMMELAAQYQVVLPISLYERKNNALYNSIVVIDADGSLLETYREYRSHVDGGASECLSR